MHLVELFGTFSTNGVGANAPINITSKLEHENKSTLVLPPFVEMTKNKPNQGALAPTPFVENPNPKPN